LKQKRKQKNSRQNDGYSPYRAHEGFAVLPSRPFPARRFSFAELALRASVVLPPAYSEQSLPVNQSIILYNINLILLFQIAFTGFILVKQK